MELLLPLVASSVLCDGVLDGLIGQRVLQLGGGHGKPVDEEHQVHGVLVVDDKLDLPSQHQPVLVVLCQDVWVHPVGGLEVGAVDLLAEELEPVTEYVERLDQRIENGTPPSR
jgi:hypothetical protein